MSTQTLPDGIAYRSSSLPSLHLQAKGSECSLTTRRRVAERKSPHKRRCVGAHNSSSGPCVLNLSIEQNPKFLASHFFGAAKVIHRWLRRSNRRSSSPPMNNFGRTISTRALACVHRRPRRWFIFTRKKRLAGAPTAAREGARAPRTETAQCSSVKMRPMATIARGKSALYLTWQMCKCWRLWSACWFEREPS